MLDPRRPRIPGGIFLSDIPPPAAATYTPPPVAGFPLGGLVWYAGGPLDIGPEWLLCAGQEVLAADYPDLAQLLGTLWEAAFGAASPGHIRIPDLGGRMPVGSAGVVFTTGDIGGEKDHTLTIAELPPHRHEGTVTTGAGPTGGPTDGVPAHNSTPAAAQPWQASIVGGGVAHNNMPPYIVMNAFMRALP